MRPSRSFALLILLATCLAGGAQLQDKLDLVWKPKQGLNTTYRLKLDTKAEGVSIVFSAEMGVKVATVETNGDYTLETLFKNAAIAIDGKEEKLGDDGAPAKPEIQKFTSKGEPIGEIKQPEEDDAFSSIIADTIDFNAPLKPVGIGDTWKHEIAGNKTKKPAVIEYKFAERTTQDKFEAVRISYTYKETEGEKPVTASGSFYLDLKDFSLIRAEATIENLKLDAETAATSATITVQRQ